MIRAATSRPDWMYRGGARQWSAGLTPDQRDYAMTLRRKLAERLQREAEANAKGSATRNPQFWSTVATACRREAARVSRAQLRHAREARRS